MCLPWENLLSNAETCIYHQQLNTLQMQDSLCRFSPGTQANISNHSGRYEMAYRTDAPNTGNRLLICLRVRIPNFPNFHTKHVFQMETQFELVLLGEPECATAPIKRASEAMDWVALAQPPPPHWGLMPSGNPTRGFSYISYIS